jgi:hypothetical protein
MQSTSNGAVTGAVRTWLKCEGLAVLVLSVMLYRYTHSSWWTFGILLLTPDLSMLAYLANPRAGSISYNIVHSYVLPVALAIFAIATDRSAMAPYLLIWTAHIGMDRALGYGLKYPNAFGSTHIDTLRRKSASATASAI